MTVIRGLEEARRNRPANPSPSGEYRFCAYCSRKQAVQKMHGPVNGLYYCSVAHRNGYFEEKRHESR